MGLKLTNQGMLVTHTHMIKSSDREVIGSQRPGEYLLLFFC